MAKEKLNLGHWHEATGRTHCVSEIIQNMLLEHPAIKQDKYIKTLIEDAQSKLEEAYQLCGDKM